MSNSEYVLEAVNLTKTFPGVKALDQVSLRVRPGTVHALMGENGAGKSTLMKCIYGIYSPDEGSISINGKQVSITSPRNAMDQGIAMIHQELHPVRPQTVAENIFLGRIPYKKVAGVRWVDKERLIKETEEVFKKLGLDINPKQKVAELSTSYCQLIEIARSVYSDFGYIKKALDLKTDGYLVKPSKREEKLEVIGKLCRTVEEEKKINLRQDGIESALGVVNSVLGSEILMSVFSDNCDNKEFDAYCNINNIQFFGGCIATFLPQTKTDLSKKELNDELEKCLTGFCDFLATITSKGIVVMFFVQEEVEKEKRREWSNDLASLVAECLKERTKVEYLYGTGNVYDSFEKMSDSYRDSVQMLQINRREEGSIPKESSDKIQDYVDETKRYIDIWFRKDISLMDCAQNVGISSYYLSHIFRERTGTTFVEYLSGVRMQEAKRLCIQTDLTLNEISEKCGYVNLTYFCKVFKRITGMTISEYRKSQEE